MALSSTSLIGGYGFSNVIRTKRNDVGCVETVGNESYDRRYDSIGFVGALIS